MKKGVSAVVLVAAVCLCVSAQEEKKIAAGIGAELNMNTRELFAGGLALSFDYNLPVSLAPLAVGFTVTCSNNFRGTTVAEFAALFRWYFQGKEHQDWFAQAETGYSLISERREKQNLPLPFLTGLRIGHRKLIGKSFYMEPYAGLGYSFFLRGGVIAGMRF